MERDRDLNQTLQKQFLFAGRGAPDVFPNFVGLEEFSSIEEGGAVLEAGVVHRSFSFGFRNSSSSPSDSLRIGMARLQGSRYCPTLANPARVGHP
jgi:hypothetical protein